MSLRFEKVYTEDYHHLPYTSCHKLGLFWHGRCAPVRTLFMIPIEHRKAIPLCMNCDHRVAKRFYVDSDEQIPDTEETKNYCFQVRYFCGIAARHNPLALVNMPTKCPFFEPWKAPEKTS